MILLALLLLAPALQAAATSQATATPNPGTVGHDVVLVFTKTASYVAGPQRGNVTPVITGPENATLPARSYNFTDTNPLLYKSENLTWNWTPSREGNYTVAFYDQATQGQAAFTTLQVHVSALDAQVGGGGQVTSSTVPWGLVLDGVLIVAAILVFLAPRRTPWLRILLAIALLAAAVAIIQRW